MTRLPLLVMLAMPAHAAEPARALAPPVPNACISSPFGPRNLPGTRAARLHTGVDFPAPAGAWVAAAAAGRIAQIRRLGSDGLEVDVAHRDAGGAYVTRYAHLGSVAPDLARGKRAVAAGQRLGRVGRTGITYGTHLHFEVRIGGEPVDPEPLVHVARCGKPAG